MKKLADINFKRNIMMKWMFATQERQRAKAKLENYNFRPVARQGTGVSALSGRPSVLSDMTEDDPMKIDQLDSTGEILAAHNAIENQLNMLSGLSSPGSGGGSTTGLGENPQKKVLQGMMMQLKDRFSQIKKEKENKELDRSQRLLNKSHNRTMSMDDMERQADI